ncbi:protein phosphatase 2C domain-containing protein [Galbitalea sp. SE-J8]|uniref:PP2C family protein-serine/threonine phosphatase n=1 Tax=Galbitalea sp. SE-J8 TaxID=3054952 RepID=UPI00259C896B|nr:protein phosphatase 2C domain-containing protein [Galbitalea sp. SE-J8]MDM4763475.1 protein phosphatase 2C domain-containing protein [Galbitalea sp. SE-J8]
MTEIGQASAATTVAFRAADESPVRLAWAAVTDVGRKRQTNEDSYLVQPPVFAVADGMGGHLAGDLASAAVVVRLSERLTGPTATTADVERALFEATYDIGVIAGESDIGVGTTVTGAVLMDIDGVPYFGVFNVGDSRVYEFEGGMLHQVTTDHSLVQELVDSGLITRAQAFQHPEGNIITRAIGFEARPVPDYVLVPVRRGLRLVVCSDGLTGEVREDRVRSIVAGAPSADAAASGLVDAALVAGGRDNVTVVVVDVVDGPERGADDDDTAPDGRFGLR